MNETHNHKARKKLQFVFLESIKDWSLLKFHKTSQNRKFANEANYL